MRPLPATNPEAAASRAVPARIRSGWIWQALGLALLPCLLVGPLLPPTVQAAPRKRVSAVSKANSAPLLRFGVLSHEANLPEQLERRASENVAFILVNGLKNDSETCTESLYQQRRDWFDASEHSVIVSLAASDWLTCGNTSPLHELRVRLFDGDFSLGASKLPLTRLSVNRKFRRYVENARWELNDILFATINLPADNNHYRPDAGRNGEFEDRQVANRVWLERLFVLARQKKMRAIVLFSDGNLWQARSKIRRDGFLEVRNQITQLGSKMHGKVLLIDHQPEQPVKGIIWRGNIGHISLGSGWHEFRVNANQAQPFAVSETAP